MDQSNRKLPVRRLDMAAILVTRIKFRSLIYAIVQEEGERERESVINDVTGWGKLQMRQAAKSVLSGATAQRSER